MPSSRGHICKSRDFLRRELRPLLGAWLRERGPKRPVGAVFRLGQEGICDLPASRASQLLVHHFHYSERLLQEIGGRSCPVRKINAAVANEDRTMPPPGCFEPKVRLPVARCTSSRNSASTGRSSSHRAFRISRMSGASTGGIALLAATTVASESAGLLTRPVVKSPKNCFENRSVV